jgi:CDP-glycerol glycerophosphotransferase (TagB/SpsB family)
LRHGRPSLSIVVLAAGGDPGRLRVTLDSVRDQPSPAIEIVVVGVGDAADVSRAAALGDTRVTFVPATDLVAAQARAVRRARGSHVLLASAGDRYPSTALSDLVAALRPTETLLLADDAAEPGAADLDSRPEIARSPYLGRLVVPREQLVAALEATPVLDDPDGLRPALLLLGAGVEVTPFRSYVDARQDPPGPFQARRDPLPGLGAHVERDRDTLAALLSHPAAQVQRAVGALTLLHPFLAAAEGAAAEQRELLSTHAGALLELAGDAADEVDVLTRVLASQAAEGRYDDLIALVASRSFTDGFPTQVEDGTVHARLGDGDAAVLSESETPLLARLRRLRVEDGDLVLEVLAGVRLVDTVAPRVEACLVADQQSVPVRVEVGSDAAVTRWLAEPEQDHDGGLLTLRIAAGELDPGRWRIDLDWVDQGVRRSASVDSVTPTGSASRTSTPLVPEQTTVTARERHGRLVLVVAEGTEVSTDSMLRKVEASGGALRVTTSGTVMAMRLEGNGRSLQAVPGGAPGFWTIPLIDDPWGLGEAPLPSGSYRLLLDDAGARRVADQALVDTLPAVHRTALHRVEVLHHPRDGVTIRLDPLLTDDELGVRAQRRLQVGYAQVTEPLDERLVYFQSFTGQWPGDHPLAIQAELHRRRPDLDVRWLVADSSATAPAGTRPVLFRSREWYDVLARASYLVTNIELEKFVVRREGQQILQTFHGYPSKAMGLGLWRPRGLLPSQIESQLDHTSRVWNNLLTPDPEMDQYYRRDYAYDGRILALGYPRNDDLIGPALAELRVATRARLGISEQQRVVLYAPTWRDDLATNFRAAEAVHHLDVERAAAALGEGYVLLMRGHRFHAPTRGSGSRVIDVTGHPDINHLIAASDAAVLDYSSLRFDFAITGKPMVFLVPDLDAYGSSTRGFLWDYRETAPGPLVADTAEVVAELRDLDRLTTRWSADQVAFNARYNRLQDGRASERVVTEFFGPLL